ncbi:glutathione S-transferase family protein [Allorhizobium borbori]|uniref:Glutathione S-transferase n=1 Tax=Allorhizobium borbori TaxID=485907 RepID=A0A7W6JZV0_9HYPH|nr:glutathione S-transferase family protein [Allorhizobium borbori]MBB4102580.1 glutathione S-transferase [Allorhizobium borbori]
MPELLLYSNPMSRGRIARWMLEEIGQPYRMETLAWGAPMKSPAFLALNPMGKVPVLVHGNAVVSETAAICAYLGDTFSEAGLAPRMNTERAAYYRWLFFTAGPLEAAITNRAFNCEPPEEKSRAVGYGTFNDVMNALEVAVSTTAYIAGDRFTAADVYVGGQIQFGLQFGTLEKKPAFLAYWDRLKSRPAYLRAADLDNAAAEAMKP